MKTLSFEIVGDLYHFGSMAFAISVSNYFCWRGRRVLAAGASHHMLCFLYSGDRWPPAAVHWVKGRAVRVLYYALLDIKGV